ELARFADLAQLPGLAGHLHLGAQLSANADGSTRVELQGSTEDLATGVPLADALLGPEISLAGDVDRDPHGNLAASNLHFAGRGLQLTGEAESDESLRQPTGTLHAELPRLADLGPALQMHLQGRATLEAELARGPARALRIDLTGEGLGTDRPLMQRLTA